MHLTAGPVKAMPASSTLCSSVLGFHLQWALQIFPLSCAWLHRALLNTCPVKCLGEQRGIHSASHLLMPFRLSRFLL